MHHGWSLNHLLINLCYTICSLCGVICCLEQALLSGTQPLGAPAYAPQQFDRSTGQPLQPSAMHPQQMMSPQQQQQYFMQQQMMQMQQQQWQIQNQTRQPQQQSVNVNMDLGQVMCSQEPCTHVAIEKCEKVYEVETGCGVCCFTCCKGKKDVECGKMLCITHRKKNKDNIYVCKQHQDTLMGGGGCAIL